MELEEEEEEEEIEIHEPEGEEILGEGAEYLEIVSRDLEFSIRSLETISEKIVPYVSDRESWSTNPSPEPFGLEHLRVRKDQIMREFQDIKGFLVSKGYLVRKGSTVTVFPPPMGTLRDGERLKSAILRTVRSMNEAFGMSRMEDESRFPVLFPPQDETEFEEMVKKLVS